MVDIETIERFLDNVDRESGKNKGDVFASIHKRLYGEGRIPVQRPAPTPRPDTPVFTPTERPPDIRPQPAGRVVSMDYGPAGDEPAVPHAREQPMIEFIPVAATKPVVRAAPVVQVVQAPPTRVKTVKRKVRSKEPTTTDSPSSSPAQKPAEPITPFPTEKSDVEEEKSFTYVSHRSPPKVQKSQRVTKRPETSNIPEPEVEPTRIETDSVQAQKEADSLLDDTFGDISDLLVHDEVLAQEPTVEEDLAVIPLEGPTPIADLASTESGAIEEALDLEEPTMKEELAEIPLEGQTPIADLDRNEPSYLEEVPELEEPTLEEEPAPVKEKKMVSKTESEVPEEVPEPDTILRRRKARTGREAPPEPSSEKEKTIPPTPKPLDRPVQKKIIKKVQKDVTGKEKEAPVTPTPEPALRKVVKKTLRMRKDSEEDERRTGRDVELESRKIPKKGGVAWTKELKPKSKDDLLKVKRKKKR